jgi:hypothetical protein
MGIEAADESKRCGVTEKPGTSVASEDFGVRGSSVKNVYVLGSEFFT